MSMLCVTNPNTARHGIWRISALQTLQNMGFGETLSIQTLLNTSHCTRWDLRRHCQSKPCTNPRNGTQRDTGLNAAKQGIWWDKGFGRQALQIQTLQDRGFCGPWHSKHCKTSDLGRKSKFKHCEKKTWDFKNPGCAQDRIGWTQALYFPRS